MKKQVVQVLQPIVDISAEELYERLETPPSREQGDVAFPCFTLAKLWRKSPQAIAQEIKKQLHTVEIDTYHIDRVEEAGGYINFFFNREQISVNLLRQSVHDLLDEHQMGQNKTIVLEYSAPNIAKHFKLYHIRSTMIGQALANVYDALGYKVERINHIGDWGTQFGKLMAAYHKWGDSDQIKADPISEMVALYVRFHEEAEHNPALEDEGRLWFKRLEEGDEEAVHLWEWFVDESLKEFNYIYSILDVTFDHYLGESFYSNQMDNVLNQLREKQLLEESDGALVVRLDEQNIPPCIIQKSDGTSIYATRDLAAAIYRQQTFHPEKIIYVVDQRQSLHFEQVFSVLQKMDAVFVDRCEHVEFGIMRIEGEVGSTRKGKGLHLTEVLTHAIQKAKEIIEEKNPALENKDETAQAIGTGAIVFNDLKHHRTHDIDFKWDEAFNFEGKTGPYVQYTHARICSLLRRSTSIVRPVPHPVYTREGSWEIIHAIRQYPQVLMDTAKRNDPSQIAKYLLDLCQLFNRFYAQERIFIDDSGEQQAKLALCQKTKEIIKHGLSMLTIKAPEKI